MFLFTKKLNFFHLTVLCVHFVTVRSLFYEYGEGFMFKHDPLVRIRRTAETTLGNRIKDSLERFYRPYGDSTVVFDPTVELFPEPLQLPSIHRKTSGLKLNMTQVQMFGLSGFQVDHINCDLIALQANINLSIPMLDIRGLYGLSSWVSDSQGKFNILVSNIYMKSKANFFIDYNGYLQVNTMKMDMDFEKLNVDFKNLGLLLRTFQKIVNSIGKYAFERIKPMIWYKMERRLKAVIDSHSRSLLQQFPNSINPIDVMIGAMRKNVKQNGMDPMPLPYHLSKRFSWGKHEFTHGELFGLSTIHRNGDILLGFDNNVAHVKVHLGVNDFQGVYHWSLSLFDNLFTKQGEVEITFDHLDIQLYLKQLFNHSETFEIEDLKVNLGHLTLSSDGTGTMDYILEALFNISPKLFENKIMKAIHYPLTSLIEEKFQNIIVHQIIKQ